MPAPVQQRETGYVRSLCGTFGFIEDDLTGNSDIYFHASRVRLGDTIQRGSGVSYVVQNDKLGLRAVSIEALDEAD
jgi:cold shock CspA family protein